MKSQKKGRLPTKKDKQRRTGPEIMTNREEKGRIWRIKYSIRNGRTTILSSKDEETRTNVGMDSQQLQVGNRDKQ